MKWKIFLLVFLAPLFLCQADDLKENLATIYEEKNQGEEVVISLKDGNIACGRLSRIPSIHYPFWDLSFKTSELSGIIFHGENNQKVQYITSDGQNFIADAPNEKFKLSENHFKKNQFRELDSDEIAFILFRNKENYFPYKNLFSLELYNGDIFPVYIESDSIEVMNGKKNSIIKINELLELNFNGGVYGYKGTKVSPKRIDFSFAKEKFLTVHVQKNSQTVKLPWNLIASIHKYEEGYKNPLYLENPFVTHPLEGAKGHAAVTLKMFDKLDDLAFERPLGLIENVISNFKQDASFENFKEIAFNEYIKLTDKEIISIRDELDSKYIIKKNTPGEDFSIQNSKESQPAKKEAVDNPNTIDWTDEFDDLENPN